MQLIFQRDEAEDGGGAGGHRRGWRGRRVERIRVQMQTRYGNSTIASLNDNIHDVTLPGLVTRAPCTISPYHYRLDWLMWFAAFQKYQQVKHSNILSIRILCKLTNFGYSFLHCVVCFLISRCLQNPWLLHLMGKMLEGDPIVDSLLAHNPFQGGTPPARIRARHYKVT